MDIANPKLFREMSEPLESAEVAKANMKAFYAAFREIREKFHVQNAVAVISMAYTTNDGDESSFMSLSACGDSAQAAGLLAYGYGVVMTEQQNFLGRLLKGES